MPFTLARWVSAFAVEMLGWDLWSARCQMDSASRAIVAIPCNLYQPISRLQLEGDFNKDKTSKTPFLLHTSKHTTRDFSFAKPTVSHYVTGVKDKGI